MLSNPQPGLFPAFAHHLGTGSVFFLRSLLGLPVLLALLLFDILILASCLALIGLILVMEGDLDFPFSWHFVERYYLR